MTWYDMSRNNADVKCPGFKSGDKITRITINEGHIINGDKDTYNHNNTAILNNGETITFAKDMRNNRTVFHGHDIVINVGEKTPIRTIPLWVVICKQPNKTSTYAVEFTKEANAIEFYDTKELHILSRPIRVEVPESSNI